ncbi:hypothetical protein EMCRGX_G006430 [Ephydatia muelleri]
MAETAKLIELLQQQLEAQRKQTGVLIAAFTSGAVKQESSSCQRAQPGADRGFKPGETVQELAAHIRQDSVTCDFPSIRDPLNEAVRTRFMCYEAVLKSLFKIKDNELTFARAIAVAVETEEAAKGTISVLKKLGRSWGNQGSHKPQVDIKSQMDTPFQHWEFSAFQWYSRTAQVPARLLHSLSPRFSSQLLGRDVIIKLGIIVSALMGLPVNIKQNICPVRPISQELKPDAKLGCLKDFELDVMFKADAKPVFCKPRVVPLAIQEDLSTAYDAGIARGVWQSVQFNNYGTLVVPIRKVTLPGQTTAKLRVCGVYSVTVNPQLEPHRHPIPRPEDLMQKLGGGYGFTKIDLLDA